MNKVFTETPQPMADSFTCEILFPPPCKLMGTSTSRATQQNTLAASRDVRRRLSCKFEKKKHQKEFTWQIVDPHMSFQLLSFLSQFSSSMSNHWIQPIELHRTSPDCGVAKDGHVNWASPTAPLNSSQRADSHRPQWHSGDLKSDACIWESRFGQVNWRCFYMFLLATAFPLYKSASFVQEFVLGRLGRCLACWWMVPSTWVPNKFEEHDAQGPEIHFHSIALSLKDLPNQHAKAERIPPTHQRPRLWGHVVRCAHHGVGPTFQFSQLFRHLWHEKHEGHGAVANSLGFHIISQDVSVYLNLLVCLWCLYGMYYIILY